MPPLLLFLALLSLLTTSTSSYSLCSTSTATPCLPCPSSCSSLSSCPSSSTCASSCSIQSYFSSSTSQCLACPLSCNTCSSSSLCSKCNDPYVLVNNSCTLCTILNAVRCNTTVYATLCQDGYYLNEGYCSNCLLNCKICTSSSSCTSCSDGYYLNSSILTCNPCPTNCLSCDPFTPSNCLSCTLNNYKLVNNVCVAVVCNITNCVYCSDDGVCGRCGMFYYWNGGECVMGGSLGCAMGGKGVLPNMCVNGCGDYGYVKGNSSSDGFKCNLYSSVYVYPVEYHQLYYYAYHHQTTLNSLTSTNTPLILLSTGQYAYTVPTSGLTWSSTSNYYKITLLLKYTGQSGTLLTISATTPTTTQSQITLLNASSTPSAVWVSTSVVHSYNLKIVPNNSVNMVQMVIRMARCSSGCRVCLNRQLCQLCQSPNFMLSWNCVSSCGSYIHYLPNMTCLTSCPSLYYQTTINNTKYCTTCIAPCLTCTNSTFCLSCTTNYYYYNYSCQTTCPSGYYANNVTNVCSGCVTPCRTCRGENVCLSCRIGFWNGSGCSSSCPQGYYGDSNAYQCVKCDGSCLTCVNSAFICTSCNSSLILHNSQCLSSCPARYYPNTNNSGCSQCLPPCYTCTNSLTCLTCSYHYLLNTTCISQCPSGYYQDQSSLSCLQCPSYCFSCASALVCTSCNNGSCLYNGQCVISCPVATHYPINSMNGSCSCSQCVYPCSSCSNVTYCLSCIDGYLSSGSCLATCPSTYYANLNTGNCTLCSTSFANCLICTISGCTLCNTNFYVLNGSCTASCPSYYYPSASECILCVAPCLTCSDPSTCQSCISPYSLYGNTCLYQCSTGMISLEVGQVLRCVACQSPCLTCSISTTNCTYCLYGYYLYNFKCLSNCSSLPPLNTYYSQSSTLSCQLCSFPCKQCLSQSQCLSCRIGYYNPSTYTCRQCTTGTYASNGTCVGCPVACALCFSDNYCTMCNSGYYLYMNQCVDNSSVCVENGYYVGGRVCYRCLQPCAKCSGSATNCTTCLAGYIYHPPNQCLINCPTGYYTNQTSCLPCSPQCLSCVSTSTYCLSCSPTYYLLLSNSSCLSQCPATTFTSGSACTPCQYPCLQCISQTSCLSCTTGVLISTQCYTSCLSGYFAVNNTCQLCISPCQQCIGVATNCTQCISGYWLKDSTCVSLCPSTYFGQVQSRQCLTCVGLCKQCSSYINCTQCPLSFIFYISVTSQLGQCITSCPTKYYLQNNTCNKCMDQCLTCVNGSQCILCTNSLVQYQGLCYNQCPGGMYQLSGVCTACSFPCENCTDTYTCTSCPGGYLLVGGSSCLPGPSCPSGYYLTVDAPECDKKCPEPYYNLVNNTCNIISCGDHHFMGTDYFCYSQCPANYIANTTYHCIPCTQCNGLYFSLTYKIIKDQLYLYLTFTQTPLYTTRPSLTLSPPWPITSLNFPLQEQIVAATSNYNFTGQTNLTFQIKAQQSLQATYLTVTFQQQLQTFINPLQKASSTIYIDGYDYYDPSIGGLGAFGVITLAAAVIGLAKNPYMLDFAQLLFLIGLVDSHFPHNLASFLQSTSIAHLHGVVRIEQENSLGEGKFMYLTGTGFLSNTITNWLIVIIGLVVSLVLYITWVCLRKGMSYSRVHDNNQPVPQPIQSQPPCLLTNLQPLFSPSSNFKYHILNRLFYFNSSIISLFALVQLANLNTTTILNLLSSILTIPVLLAMLYYAISLRNDKPKYTFLYIRKILISGAVVLSLKDAIYAIGIISVCNLTAAILIMTYKLEKYRYQSKFLAGCQLAQLLVQACLSFFIMIGQGNSTSTKVTLCYFIVILIMLILTAYILEAILQLVCYIYLKCKGVQLRQQWKLNKDQDQDSSHHSESINGSMKDAKKTEKGKEEEKKEMKGEEHMESLLAQLQEEMKEKMESEILPKDSAFYQSLERSPDKKGVFWAYQQSEKDQKEEHSQKSPPKMLVRCINEFSDLGDGQEEAK